MRETHHRVHHYSMPFSILLLFLLGRLWDYGEFSVVSHGGGGGIFVLIFPRPPRPIDTRWGDTIGSSLMLCLLEVMVAILVFLPL